MKPLISVVIPTFRRADLLKRCLLSLANQTLSSQKYEVIVVSDGPDKTTADLQNTLILNINMRFFALKAHQGPAAARNFGWRTAKASLIAFTDDDCILDTNWLSSGVTCLTQGTQAATGKIIVPLSNNPTDFELNTKRLEESEFLTANCFMTKNTLEQVSGFDESFYMAFREDSDLQFKLIEKGVNIKKLHCAIVIHPVRNTPWWISLREQKKSMFNALLFKKHPKLYKMKFQKPSRLYYLIILTLLGAAFSLIFLPAWILLITAFTYRRAKYASHSVLHLLSLLITSIFIPFLAVFWRIYGAYKYRVNFF